ncbi:hypothetical protein [Burkholderia pseudomallei]|uniref:hypothetical protein n=1 Tax=Burkholderia pseudomallei TaxID=28450 RepID=UPI00052AAC70|nr:hypothetical protein [Burkholderia pseudomallei]AIV53162.1 hypothetical protein Y603_1916 [Burkholderia pseudomallei MSHR1153]KGS60104.1 hypothetical protein X949_241 [Burkholderia pseudomallei MSHR5609]
MANTIKLVAQMCAFETGRAIRIASHQQMIVQPHALVICPLAMAGEDTTIHAVAVGAIGAEPQIRVVPDPRVRDDQYDLVLWLGEIVEGYFQRCRAIGDFPQIWTSSGSAAGHLDVLADRLRFVRDNAPVQRVGALLTYATERTPIAGQQALMTMTGALSAHYATGQQDGENEHLGALLVWLDPPADGSIRRAIAMAEQEVMGVKTDPSFDRDELQPLISSYHETLKRGGAAEIQMRAKAIENALAPIVGRIYAATQRGFGFLLGQFPAAGILAELKTREAAIFENFMQARDNGLPLPYRDTPKAGAFKIVEREYAVQSMESGAIYGDAVAQARARLSGDVLSGKVCDISQTKEGRKTVHRFSIETVQANLHIRTRDTLAWLGDTRLQCVVEGVDKQGAVTKVHLRMSAGMKIFGSPNSGSEMELATPPTDWNLLGKQRQKMAKRLANTPWTHVRDAATPPHMPHSGPPPTDLLAAIEALR